MRYRYFQIEKFKGIEKLTLDVGRAPNQKVFALVGLNESGKTTILEAINHAAPKRDALEAIGVEGVTLEDPHDLIPISKLLNFNGHILTRAAIEIEEDDWEAIDEFLAKELKLNFERTGKDAQLLKRLSFKNSTYDKESSIERFEFPLSVKRKGAKLWRSLNSVELRALMRFVQPRLPAILYFPNFLFEFPDKIYLAGCPAGENEEKHRFYTLVIQDILDSLNSDLDLDTHIIDRAVSFSSGDERALKSLLLEMGREVTNEVFGAWGRILGRNVSGKEVVIEHGKELDTDKEWIPYLEFKIKDKDGYFLINQRSLGFRWFFVFLLLTQYRGFRKESSRNILFLFDEPASNLHSTAQQQLLESFKKLAENCHIVYTTHSHHLINPKWLEAVFVVKNQGLEYEDGQDEFTQSKTQIMAMRYREFVSKYPSQTTYFQPILDVLDWAPSKLEFVPEAIFVEGKGDFYTMMYLARCLARDDSAKFLPAQGAGSVEPLISLYIGWGRSFIVVLDGDKEGERQKERYIKLFGEWFRDYVFTLADLDPAWRDRELEGVVSENDKKRIMRACGENDITKKKAFNRCIQELLAQDKRIDLTKPGKSSIGKLLDRIQERLRATRR